jgi:hypothetical protein
MEQHHKVLTGMRVPQLFSAMGYQILSAETVKRQLFYNIPAGINPGFIIRIIWVLDHPSQTCP